MGFVGLNKKIVAVVVLVSTAVAAFATVLQLTVDFLQERSSLDSDLEAFEKGTVEGIRQDVWNVDEQAISSKIASALRIREIVSIKVFDDESQLVGSGTAIGEHNSVYNKSKRYEFKNADKSGYGYMDVVYTEFFIVEKIKNRFFLIIALNSGKTLLVSIILIVAIRKIAVNPVRQLSGFFTKNDLFDPEATKQLDAISFSGPPDEINRLRDSVRDAVVKLQAERAENIEKQALLVTEQEKSIYAARMAELGIVAGGIAHEINNPLAIIKGLVDILKVRVRDNELSSVGKYLQKIDGALGRIAKIIQGMLQVARDGSQDPMEPAKLKDIFDTVKAVAGSGGRLADVKLEFIYPESNAYINCRRVQLEQVLINLVNNAADAVSDKNKVEKWVRIDSVRPNSGRIVIRVTDSGSGIPSEIVEKIFLPFFTSKAVGKGTGLGLSISASIIEEHDGKLAYNSEHQNTQFIIDLPLKSA